MAISDDTILSSQRAFGNNILILHEFRIQFSSEYEELDTKPAVIRGGRS